MQRKFEVYVLVRKPPPKQMMQRLTDQSKSNNLSTYVYKVNLLVRQTCSVSDFCKRNSSTMRCSSVIIFVLLLVGVSLAQDNLYIGEN